MPSATLTPGLCGAVLLVLLCGMAAAAKDLSPKPGEERRFGIEIAPEVWYAKWNPNYNPPKVRGAGPTDPSAQAGYSIKPALLSGLSVSGRYGKNMFFADYLEDLQARGSAGDTVRRWRQFAGGALFGLQGKWYLRTSLISGSFSGTAWGNEWTRAGGTTMRTIGVDTSWLEAEIGGVSRLEIPGCDEMCPIPDGYEVGYRLNTYHLPAVTQVSDSDGLARVSFEDTNFLTNSVVLGLCEYPGSNKKGFGWGFTNLKVVLGAARVKNADLNTVGFAAGGEGEFVAGYRLSWLGAFVGYKGKVTMTSVNSGSNNNQSDHSGKSLQLFEAFYGPLARLTISF